MSRMDTFPKCSVCQQQFTLKGPVPYLLPCLHPVCETCVTSAAGGVISCSTCQREVNLTDTNLQKDAVRQKEIFHLTVKHHATELLCTNDDDGNQAVCWCQECEEFLCEYCQNMHSSIKLTRKHVLQNFSDMAPTASNIPAFCSIHKHHLLYLFDKSCKKLICGKCRFDVHADREVVELDVAADTVTKQLNHHTDELSTLQARQQSHMQSIRQGTESTDRTNDSLIETICHTFQSLRSQLDQREKELLIDLESQTKETKATLYAQLTTCEEKWKTCTGLLDYIAKVLLYASKSDLVELESYVEDITRNYLETAAPQTHVVPTAVFNTNSLSTLKSNISVFGAILPRGVDEESVKDKDTQTDADVMADLEMKHKMDLTELKTKIGSDEKHMQGLKTLTDKLNAEIKSLKSCIDEKETSEKRASKTIDVLLGVATDCGVHLLKSEVVDRSMVLKCIHLKYDKDRVNLDLVHINTEGDLVNRKSDTRPAGEGRLKKYWGTCSTAPLPRAGCPQYWEMKSRVSLDKPLTEADLILEVGVCREEQRDVSHHLGGQPSSCSMLVADCRTHGGICSRTCKEGKHVLCRPDTLPNTAGASHTLHYGVVYDDTRKKIAFSDVKENKVMSTLDNVDSRLPLWPMFGVYMPSSGNVSMTLVVGSDINMTEEKKAMIVKALS
ncbi:probable RING finger protein 207 homolog [Haliotis rufescens]|uniref:probable RING finger protein 207 homolog n=1 Tax=Haliotis rufescens TaxID=6454 RepID=UPI00201F3770|nr:probable RING finger protein 207 homolog [Haliotis rufescens]